LSPLRVALDGAVCRASLQRISWPLSPLLFSQGLAGDLTPKPRPSLATKRPLSLLLPWPGNRDRALYQAALI